MKKYTKEELFMMDAVDVYKLVLTRKIGRFPSGFWQQPEALQNAAKCTRFLIESVLNISDEDIKKKFSAQIFNKNKLSGMLAYCCSYSPYKALNLAYPGKYKPWEFNSVPVGYWDNIENAVDAIHWLIEEKLKLSDEEIKEQVSLKLFEDNGLSGMLQLCFNSSLYQAINAAYPNKFRPWELQRTSLGYWDNIENAVDAIHWLIEEKLKLSDEEIKEQLSGKIFVDNGLSTMLTVCFNGSPYQAINAAYPNKFKPWELGMTPLNYWSNIENAVEAIHWLIEEKLKLSDEEIKEQLSVKLFIDNNLFGMLHTCFNSSPYQAINAAYPNKFKPSDFKMKPKTWYADNNR